MDVVTLALAKKGAKQYTDTVINNLPKGVVYKGSVNYYNDLPNNANLGDCYTVLYTGTSGTTAFEELIPLLVLMNGLKLDKI